MNVPKLRFKDENKADYPEWEIGELKQFCQVNPKAENLPDEFIYIDLESVESGQLLKESLILLEDAPSRAQRLLQVNDVLFQMVRPYQQNNLFFDKVGQYVASTGYAQIRTTENPKFLYYCLHVQEFVSEVMNRCTGTSYPAINSADLETIEIAKPFIEEQQKIANFLSAVDDKITALTAQKTALTQYKQGMMQRIFSQTLRFKDDNGADYPDWKNVMFGDIASFSKGKGISKADISDGGKLECIRYGELYTYYKETIKNVVSRTNQLPSALVLSEANDVIIPASGETQLDIATASCVLKAGVALGGDLNIIKSDVDGVFLAYYLNNAKKQSIANLAQGISVVHLYASQLKTMDLDIPEKQEQQKIAQFLTELDDKINAVDAQIQSAQQWKQGLLQQMFV